MIKVPWRHRVPVGNTEMYCRNAHVGTCGALKRQPEGCLGRAIERLTLVMPKEMFILSLCSKYHSVEA